MRDANLLARGPDVDTAFPVQPVRAGLRGGVGPAFALVELGEEREQAIVGGVEVADELGDLRFEGGDLHGEVLSRRRAGLFLRSATMASRITGVNVQKCVAFGWRFLPELRMMPLRETR